jgi:hypothetical protein
MDIDRARERFARGCGCAGRRNSTAAGHEPVRGAVEALPAGPLRRERGGQPPDYTGRLNLADAWSVRPTRELLDKLSAHWSGATAGI